jgi:hypothetical protein
MSKVHKNQMLPKFLITAFGFASLLPSCYWLVSAQSNNFISANFYQDFWKSTAKAELNDIQDFYRRVFGAPGDSYIINWNQVKQFTKGNVPSDRVPYVDSWYPQRTGGTNINGALSKYDRAFNSSQNSAAAWEKDNHNEYEPSWQGHCNGTSVTVSRFQNPRRSVSRPTGCFTGSNSACTVFTPTDIRALLAEINMSARYKFIAGHRCRLDIDEIKSRPALRSDPQKKDFCDDVDPASFHLALVNFLGRKRQPVMFDRSLDTPVWNYPIYSYQYSYSSPLSAAQAIAKTGLNLSSWVFNPYAVSFYHVRMNIVFRNAANNTEGAGTIPAGTQEIYDYILEVDKDGDIMGGEWIGESKYKHPDFVWIPFEAHETSESGHSSNPHISTKQVERLWAESVGFDLDNPFRDEKNSFDIRFSPRDDNSWGIVPKYYRVLLDGKSSGIAFRGKKTYLKIITDKAMRGQESSATIYVNGEQLATQSPDGQGVIELSFESPASLNYLAIRWQHASISPSELDWEFRYVAM